MVVDERPQRQWSRETTAEADAREQQTLQYYDVQQLVQVSYVRFVLNHGGL